VTIPSHLIKIVNVILVQAIYDQKSGTYTGNTTTQGVLGEFIQLKLPRAIVFAAVGMMAHSKTHLATVRAPKKFKLFGRLHLSASSQWTEILCHADVNKSTHDSNWGSMRVFQVGKDTNTTKFDLFRLVIEALIGGNSHCSIAMFELFSNIEL
jgi:hypothetical protein